MLYDANGRLLRPKETRTDFWMNPQTGYGGGDDSVENTNYYADPPLSEHESNSLYENGGVWSRAINAPVDDRLSKGVTFVINDDDSESKQAEIERVEKDLKDIDVFDKLIEANYWSRLHGGGMLYFDFGDDRMFSQTNRRINFELRDNRRGIPNKVWVLDRWQAIPQSYYNDQFHGPDHPNLGEVETYSLNLFTTGYSKLVYAHESRCVKIDGLPLTPRRKAANHMWGGAVFQKIYKAMRFLGLSLKSMTDVLDEWNYKSLGIPGLSKMLLSNKPEDVQAILSAIAIATQHSHNQSVGMYDSTDGTGNLTKHTSQASGVDSIVNVLTNFFCGEVGIPYSRLFSAEGGALAGTSAETDVKNYLQSLRHDQNHRDAKAVRQIIYILGYDPEKLPFIWPPLHESTRLEEIEERDKQADVDVKYITSAVVLPEEIRNSRFSNPEPNLDQVIIDHSLDSMIERDEDDIGDEEQPNPENEKPEEKNMPEKAQEKENSRSDIAENEDGEYFKIEAFIKESVVEKEDIEIV